MTELNTESTGYIDPMESPAAANAAIDAMLKSGSRSTPIVDAPPSDVVMLPGGLVDDDGRVIRDVEVTELTGAHEEKLAKAKRAENVSRFVVTLLECGVVRIGDSKPTPKLLRSLLIGDRDAIILGIRRATYGDDLDLKDFVCPHCEQPTPLEITLDDIPTRTLDDPKLDMTFTVELSKGRKASVRLANGGDQEEILANLNLSLPEQNSLLLSRCVLSVIDSNGMEHPVVGRPALVRDGLNIPDRAKIIAELNDRQPGPRYDEVSFVHDGCGKEVLVPLGVGDLFLGV